MIVMKYRLAACFVLTVFFWAAVAPVLSADGGLGKTVYVIPVEQTIETGLQKFLERAYKEAEKAEADRIILAIDTLGGRVDAALGIGKLIRTSPVPTIAFVQGEALSAGSYIALNADEIVMARGSSIGAAAIVTSGGQRVTDSKLIAAWVGNMTAAAELNNRNPLYAAKMVDDSREVEVAELGKTYGKGELISFTAEEAVKTGYAESIQDDLEGVLQYAGLSEANVVYVELTLAERLARFFTHPAMMTILLIVGFGGIVIELFVPGFGVPGILGITAFILYFLGHSIAGFAGTEHLAMFVAGVILLVLELFIPSFGILGILGIAALLGGVVLAAYDTGQALLSLGAALVTTVIILIILFRFFKHRGVWNRFILRDEFRKEFGYVSQSPKEHLLGKDGVALTVLRPSGTALIDGERVDVVTEGEFLEKGTPITVHHVEGTRVVVRKKEDNQME